MLIVKTSLDVLSIDVVSMTGATLLHTSSSNSISTAGLAPGVYVLTATMSDGTQLRHKFATR